MKRTELPSVSEAEWKVMEILWRDSPKTSFEIIEALEGESEWSPKTVKTLLFRLVKKGVISFEKTRREYAYFPLIERATYLHTESDGFLQRMFSGATAPMIAHFVKSKKLSGEEVAEIKKLLEEISQEGQE